LAISLISFIYPIVDIVENNKIGILLLFVINFIGRYIGRVVLDKYGGQLKKVVNKKGIISLLVMLTFSVSGGLILLLFKKIRNKEVVKTN